MRFKCSYRPHKLWYRHKTMKIRRITEKHHYMKMNLMLRQWTDSALWKNPSIGYQSQGINSLPAASNAYSTNSVMQHDSCNRFSWTQCIALKLCQHTLDPFWVVMSQRTYFEVVIFGPSFFWSTIFWPFENINLQKILIFVQKMSLIQMLTVLLIAQGQRNLL